MINADPTFRGSQIQDNLTKVLPRPNPAGIHR
jgi:hypothetical protein